MNDLAALLQVTEAMRSCIQQLTGLSVDVVSERSTVCA